MKMKINKRYKHFVIDVNILFRHYDKHQNQEVIKQATTVYKETTPQASERIKVRQNLTSNITFCELLL